jgi:hypothetical protein
VEAIAMKGEPVPLSCEVEVRPGQKLTLPAAIVESVGAGRWIVTIQPAPKTLGPVRDHSAFLHSYSAEDEGLYDDCSPG